MPISEAPNDTRDLVRVRFTTALTDNVAGVNLVRGEAQNGCTRTVAERLRAIFGHVVEIVGPWSETPAAPPAEPVVADEPAPIPTEPPASSPVAATQGAPPKAPRSRAPNRSPR